jgi:transcriptional regulator with XRE-family HTH domain
MSTDLRTKWPIVALHSAPVAITGQQIKSERRRQKLTQQELADRADVSLRTIARIERGEVQDSRNFEAIVTALGLQPSAEPDGKLLSDASMYDLLQRAQELYDEARQATNTPTYKPGSPDPDEPGLVPGPTKRTERMSRRSQTGKANQA